MNISASLQRATSVAHEISVRLHEQEMPGKLRNRLSVACFAVALDHHEAIILLLQQEHPLFSSALALVRPVYESYIRGMWLSHCATDAQLQSFAEGKSPPDMASLVAAVEKSGDFTGKQLSRVYINHWHAFCSFTHTGGLQAQRWNTPEAVEPNFDPEEIEQALEFSSAFAILSAISVAVQSNNEAIAREFLDLANTHANTRQQQSGEA